MTVEKAQADQEMKITTYNTREQWLAMRRKGVGASDAPVILGLSHFKDPYTLWCEKTGQMDDPEQTFPMWWGIATEQAVADRYVLETGNQVHDPGDYAVMHSEEHPFLFCTPDRIGRDELGRPMPVELKCVTAYSAAEWRDSNAPLMYQAQLQFQMYVMGAVRGDLAAVIGNTEMVVVPYERNERFIATMIPKLIDFWQRIIGFDAPPIGTHAGVQTWAALHPDDNGKEVSLGPDSIAAFHAWKKAKETEKAAKADVERYADQLRLAIGDASYGRVGQAGRLSYKRVQSAGSIKVELTREDALAK